MKTEEFIMKTKKKNRFFTFCFSLMPGAAEMYMGFLKTGLSLMVTFAAAIVIASSLRMGVLSVLAVVVWFYSFFHANHLASLNDEEFDEVTDEYLFGLDSLPEIETFLKKYHQWVAYILIFTGICFLWNSLGSLLYDLLPREYRFIYSIMWQIGNYVPSIIIGIGIIFAGIKMIGGKKVSVEDSRTKEEDVSANAIDMQEDK